MNHLLAYRDRFPILRETTYLINHSLAAMPAAAEERLLEYARMWRERGIRAWGEGWWDMPLTVGDRRTARRHRARRRLRDRRQRQVALRRARRGLAVRAARPRRAARADAGRVAGARAAFRVRARAGVRGRRAAVPDRHAERARAVRGHRRLRRDRGGRRRPDPRQLGPADDAADRAAGGGRLRGRLSARPGPPRRHG